MADKKRELIERSLLKERARNGRRIALIRVLGVSAVFAVSLYCGLALGQEDWRRVVPSFAVYFTASLALAAVIWRWRSTGRVAGVGLVALDIPMVFWIQRLSLPLSPSAQGTASFTLAIFCAFAAL